LIFGSASSEELVPEGTFYADSKPRVLRCHVLSVAVGYTIVLTSQRSFFGSHGVGIERRRRKLRVAEPFLRHPERIARGLGPDVSAGDCHQRNRGLVKRRDLPAA